MQHQLRITAFRFSTVAIVGALLSGFLLALPISARADTSVSVIDNSFSPKTITIAPGETVTWTNDGAMDHNVTADNGSFESSTLSPGDSYSHTFTNTGTYQYYCSFHGDAGGVGMSATVIVDASLATTSTSTSTNNTNTSASSSSSTSTSMNMPGMSTTSTTTSSTTAPTQDQQDQIARLVAQIRALEAQIEAILHNNGSGVPIPPNTGGNDMMSTIGTAVYADRYTIAPDESIHFNGEGFKAAERILVAAGNSTLGAIYADTNGKFDVSGSVSSTPGETTYWFIGQSSGNKDSVMITVKE